MKRYRVKSGAKVKLQEWAADDSRSFSGGKQKAHEEVDHLDKELDKLQELFYIDHTHKLLVVLQGMDTAGKDGTIRHIFEGVNPQGVRVWSFKVPTPEESSHDFLWRIHQKVPGNGEIVIFNRSHYEDVLAARVHKLAPSHVLKRRYKHINDFEQMLTDEGTTVLKFFLHIDKNEQRKRIESRLENPKRNWKFNPNDLNERNYWRDYQEAYEETLSKTSTDWAPWYVVPSNTKWVRNLVIGTILVETLKSLKLQYPKSPKNLDKTKVK